MQTIKERINIFLEYKGFGQAKFAELAGLSRGFVNILGEHISTKSLGKIESTFPELNTAWLLTGEGSMLKNTPENTVSEPQATYGGDTASLMMRIRMLESEVEGLKRIIEAKDDQVKAKNELIEALRGMVEFKAAKPVHNIK